VVKDAETPLACPSCGLIMLKFTQSRAPSLVKADPLSCPECCYLVQVRGRVYEGKWYLYLAKAEI
jgi:hypothetical protein